VMIAPLEAEFGWSRAQISSGILITSVIAVLFSPFMGMAIDRYGPRRIAISGSISFCCALALLSLATASIWSWWLLWSFLALALLQIKPTVWITAITSFFNRSRGLAIAIVLCASGVSQALTPMVTYRLVESFGWRSAYVFLGVGMATLVVPIVLIWFTSAQDKARGETGSPARSVPTNLPGLTIREGLHTATFIKLAIAAVTMSIAGAALTVNLFPILRSTGLPGATAATIAGVSGLCAFLGRLGGGYLLDRYNARVIGGVSVLLPVVSCALLLSHPGSIHVTLVAVVLIGFASGAELDAIAYLAGRSFGLRSFGTLFGALTGLITLGVGLGPTIANFVYDRTGSYEAFLIAVIPLSVLTSLLFLTVGAYPDFDQQHQGRGVSST